MGDNNRVAIGTKWVHICKILGLELGTVPFLLLLLTKEDRGGIHEGLFGKEII